ncbi:helix-turn-helix transcriptional regulator [Rhizohabitans arisaemae]|uniref:helix-turn-helix transcriptional regulator n=1 Tax=Rhizohabitans arisaemae TaxID=2720610 RepID=UPI0024B0EE77|nr:LuxR family transcriptional regulator [Rhizohabitans arisaemae]
MRESSLRKLLNAIRECEQAASGEDVLPRMLTALSAVVGADVIAYKAMDLRIGRIEQHPWPPVDLSVALVQAYTRLFVKHPLLAPLDQAGCGTEPLRLSDVVSRSQWHGLDLYHEFYRPLGIEYQMLGLLTVQGGTLTCIGLNRTTVDFTDADRQLLEIAQPYLAALLRAAHATTWLESALLALDTLDDASRGVLLLGPHGSARAVNRTAHVLLAAHFPAQARDGGPLPGEIRAWLAARRAVPQAAGPVPDLVIERGGRRLTVRLIPYGACGALVLSESAPAPPAPRLSDRESEVLRLVARGRTSEQTARALGISPRTVEKHLANIYAKLGVTNRTEAAMRVFGHTP